ncbi:TRAP transporter small permease subunit [Cryobacterium psychrophilum]|uniref:TRAP transporter small permease n=1 Tax=Cryobacterium psychrophilum TaxID=41988 RepID=A0A4Y8KKP0_9MICO|nr:TRAP transporter small permease [Cryobacterium psychrophilum]TDW30071.1 TRAP-type C4-dicarboxylate transport system permease small subunit [Cryobacterium psychrophilum]TFD76003.1 TRAP transporter small permease [Cryobacterium psychrophilum]
MTTQVSPPKKHALRRAIHGVSIVFAFVAAAAIAFMMVATVADVASRYFTGAPIPGVTEVGEVLMVTSVFLGLAFAEYRNAHVRVTIVLEKLPPRLAAMISSVCMLLVLVTLAWMVWVTTGRALESIEQNEFRFGLVQIPVWPGRVAIALGFAAYFFEAVLRLSDNVRNAFAKEVAPVNASTDLY